MKRGNNEVTCSGNFLPQGWKRRDESLLAPSAPLSSDIESTVRSDASGPPATRTMRTTVYLSQIRYCGQRKEGEKYAIHEYVKTPDSARRRPVDPAAGRVCHPDYQPGRLRDRARRQEQPH